MTIQPSLEADAACTLLSQVSGSPALLDLKPIRGGRNNRVWRMETTNRTYLLKQYFTHPSDNRDRLARETEFLAAARAIGCTQVPRCEAVDPKTRFAVLEWIAGETPGPESVDEAAIDQASTFIAALNLGRLGCPVILQPASEACFSPCDHLPLVEKRIARLSSLDSHDELDREMTAFVRDDVLPVWERASSALAAANLPELSVPERCLSPSDFGFHNSLREAGGKLRFVDFEYAGWDDPAKLICDFANQPDMILPVSLSDRFRQAVTTLFPNPDALRVRIRLLEPVLQVKWACICLNLFLAAGRDRAWFTDGIDGVLDAPRRNQLQRARMMLERARNTL